MFKNLILLVVLTWVSLSYAKDRDHSIVHDSIADAESYKVEKPSPEQEAQRSLAGSKIKKKKGVVSGDEPKVEEPTSGPDSEVRYWQYSE